MRNYLWIAILGALVFFATPASAQLYIGLGIRVGPPPAPHEVIIERPHRNWVWIPGYYVWRPKHHEYVWRKGHWARPPHAHAVWVEPRWENRNGEWVYTEGRWNSGVRRRR